MTRVEYIWPGENAVVPVDDRGLTYGDGLFETLRITASGPILLEAHRERLLAGCQALGIPFDGALFEQWRQEADRRGLLHADSAGDRVLRLTLTRGSGGRGYQLPPDPIPRVITVSVPAPPILADPVSAITVKQSVTVPAGRQGYKTLERLDQVQASRELPADVFEGIMVDESGHLLEGTRTNLILVRGDRITTPQRARLAVAGTLRDSLVRDLPGQGYRIDEGPVSVAEASKGGLLLVNSVIGVAVVSCLDGQPLPVTAPVERLRDWIFHEYGY